MESPEGFANSVLQARLNGVKRDVSGLKDALHRTRAEQNHTADLSWYWRAIFRALRLVFIELAKRYPNDPLFKPTGRKRGDGAAELEYQRLFDANLAKEINDMPPDVARGPSLQNLIRKVKV